MDLEEALSSHIRSLASIAALVEDRVFPDVADEDADFPYITFVETGANSVHHQSGTAGISDTQVQIDVWAANSKSRRQVSKALRKALDKYTGKMGSLTALLIKFEDRAASIEEPEEEGEDSAEKAAYRMRMEFRIVYVEDIPTHF